MVGASDSGVFPPVVPAPSERLRVRCLAEVRETAHGNAQAPRVRTRRREPNAQRLWFNAEEVRVESTMMGRAHHETVSRVIASPIGNGDDVGSVKNVQHADLAQRARWTVSSKHVETEASLSHSLSCRPRALLGGLDGQEGRLIFRQLPCQRRLVPEHNQELTGVVVLLFDPPRPHLSQVSMRGRA